MVPAAASSPDLQTPLERAELKSTFGNGDVPPFRGEEIVQALQRAGSLGGPMRSRIYAVPEPPVSSTNCFTSPAIGEARLQAGDLGTHLFVVEQGALRLPRIMQVPTCLYHLQTQGPSG